MTIEINEALQGTLTRLAELTKVTEEEAVNIIVNDFLTIEYKKEIYNKIECGSLDEIKQFDTAVDTKRAEITEARIELERIEAEKLTPLLPKE